MEEKNYISSTLKQIKEVEPSPYLFTRIQSKISSLSYEKISTRKIVFGMVCTLLLVVTNIYITKSSNAVQTDEQSVLVETFDLNTSNQLYYE